MPNLPYEERTPRSSVSPTVYRSSLRSARLTTQVKLNVGQNPNEIPNAFTDLLGTTNVAAGTGGLTRTPPTAHPHCPWLVANDITAAMGVGQFVTSAANVPLEVPVLPQFPLYSVYILDVEFGQRPYGITLDQNMPAAKKGLGWTESDGTAKTYANSYEYLRYTDWNRIAGSQYATATQGHMAFADTVNPPGPGPGGVPAGVQFPGMPRLPLPDGTIKFRWYAVPFRWLISARQVFDKYRLRVNQFPFYNGLWPAGSLLYVDYAYTPYTPPVPQLSPFIAQISATPKLVDIEFTFAHTSRQAQNPPLPFNTNFIANGWNAQPWWGDMQFHYVTTDGQPNSRPYFLSFPFELLFWDPDVPTS